MAPPHRKQVRHFDDFPAPHDLTFSCYQRMPLLTAASRLAALSSAIEQACLKHGWAIVAFVLMPEHVHLLVYPLGPEKKVADLLYAIKRPYSYRMKQIMKREGDPLLHQLTVRQRPGVSTFRFWQEGPGYDRNVKTESVALAVIDYIHLNPVRRGLVDQAVDWKWSSARWYASNGAENDAALPTFTALPQGYFAGRSDFTP